MSNKKQLRIYNPTFTLLIFGLMKIFIEPINNLIEPMFINCSKTSIQFPPSNANLISSTALIIT
jgi:hypothetical protein